MTVMEMAVIAPNRCVNEANCPVCGRDDFLLGQQVYDDRYGYPELFRLARCRGCDHLMTLPRLGERELPALYGTYYPRKVLTSDLVASQARKSTVPLARLGRWWMGVDNQGQYLAKTGQKVLDLGCGSGVSLLEAQAFGAQPFGVDADPNVERLARELGLRIHLGSIEDHPFPGVVFDLVIMNQVIEHIPEPDRALRLVVERLASSGRVVLVFPNRRSLWCKLSGLRWINWHIPYHLHHFDFVTFERLAKRVGLKVVRKRTITPNLWTILQLRACRTRVQQGQPSPVWQVKPAGSTGKPSWRTSLRLMLKRFLLLGAIASVGFVNRCVDIAGQGDCLMVELERETVR